VPLIATYDAFRFLFPWNELKGLNKFFDDTSSASTADLINLIDSYYKNLSTHFGYKIIPPESFMNNLGYDFLYVPKKQDKAKAIFNMNVQNYPTSSNVYDSMGDYYMVEKDSIKALELFTKALEIGSNNFSQQKIDLLKNSLEME
jgi:tetratricopeptide (TPR) repeat protein